jgi:isoleucyl-tRNA synthetase
MFKTVDSKKTFSKMETEITEFWKKEKIFEKSLENTKNNEEFVFYDGPPFATGLPHYGHLLAGTLKDIVPRYQTMKGKYVHRRFGWDCHGLPVEYEMEKELKLNGRKDIEELGIGKFNESCRSIVLRYTSEWRKTVERMGRWVDFDDDYKTMDPEYMESIWWVFKSLWDKGAVYESYRVVPYCSRCATPLSNFETGQAYLDVQDPAITIKFKVNEEDNTYILAWTTTPWTLISNMGLFVGDDIEYVKIKDVSGEKYILAKNRLSAYYKNEKDYEVLDSCEGVELTKLTYEPLFPYFNDQKNEGAFRVVTADYVSTEDGTGIVHSAPGFGEDDSRIGKEKGIPGVCPIDEEAKFTSEVSDYEGIYVKDADKSIIKRLKNENKLVHQSTIQHSYPHCWRCDTPLIYRSISAWYVKVAEIRDRLLKSNSQIHWVPESIKEGRFGKWLANARDWNISRNRFWGNPIPIWRCECGELKAVGSIKELEELSGEKINDIHSHFVDKIHFPCSKCSKQMDRIPEVLDCWFESGAMPYAQNHYPFENKKHFEGHFPADFIAEGLDQTRGWFYTLTILSTYLFDKPAFRNVIVNGMILAEDGKKMSKSLRNYPDPEELISEHGADAVRLYMISSPAVQAEDLKFTSNGVRDIVKSILLPLWSSYSFFVTYANIDGWKVPSKPVKVSNDLDSWILSRMQTLVKNVTNHFDSYHLNRGVPEFLKFIDELTNWYIRRSRRRFWKSENDTDKNEAYYTLYTVLTNLVKVTAPVIPFISETIFKNLCPDKESVHLESYPIEDESLIDNDLESAMAIIQKAVSIGRTLRSKHSLKIRQPLNSIYFITRDSHETKVLKHATDLIKEELNVHKVLIESNEEKVVDLSTSVNFKTMGRKLGKLIKPANSEIQKLQADKINKLIEGGVVEIAFRTKK